MPSLLVFDDLHLLCPSASEGPENPADDMHAGVASWLCDVLASSRLPGRQPLPGEASPPWQGRVHVLACCTLSQ